MCLASSMNLVARASLIMPGRSPSKANRSSTVGDSARPVYSLQARRLQNTRAAYSSSSVYLPRSSWLQGMSVTGSQFDPLATVQMRSTRGSISPRFSGNRCSRIPGKPVTGMKDDGCADILAPCDSVFP